MQPRLLRELDGAREAVRSRIRALQALTEREVLGCGRVLSDIVERVRDIIGRMEGSAAASLARSGAETSRFIGDMQADIQAQQQAVARVLALAEGMKEAVASIKGLSHYSNLLSINARVEAARIGADGAGFAVIADHTRELSRTIRETSERVATAIEAVREGLPVVNAHATSMQARTQSFIDALAASNAAAKGGATGEASGRLQEVVELTNRALSHLQFHDPLAQGLSALESDVSVAHERMKRVAAGELLEDAPLAQSAANPAQAAGKVILF
jgi:methyl-accepting chemotaxis protein